MKRSAMVRKPFQRKPPKPRAVVNLDGEASATTARPQCRAVIQRQLRTRNRGTLTRQQERRRAEQAAWEEARAVKVAADPWCEVCGVPVEHVHHRGGRAGLLLTAQDNLMSVCARCHDEIHRNPERSYALGHMVRRLAA